MPYLLVEAFFSACKGELYEGGVFSALASKGRGACRGREGEVALWINNSVEGVGKILEIDDRGAIQAKAAMKLVVVLQESRTRPACGVQRC